MVDPFGFNKKVLFTSDSHLLQLQFREVVENLGVQPDDACIVFNAEDEEGSRYTSGYLYDTLSQSGYLDLLITEEDLSENGYFTIYRSLNGDFSKYPEINIYPEKFLHRYAVAHGYNFSQLEPLANKDVLVKDAIVKNALLDSEIVDLVVSAAVDAVYGKDINALNKMSALILCSKNVCDSVRQHACIGLKESADYSNLAFSFKLFVDEAAALAFERIDEAELKKVNSLVHDVLEEWNTYNVKKLFQNLCKSPESLNKQLKLLSKKAPAR